ncbi:hypothetical protein [Bradyrhizobium sp. USDA 10063]
MGRLRRSLRQSAFRDRRLCRRRIIRFLSPSPEFGEALAHAFEESAGSLATRFFDTVQNAIVTRADLNDFCALTPSFIPGDGVERRLHQDLLFAARPLQRPADLSHCQMLLLLLVSPYWDEDLAAINHLVDAMLVTEAIILLDEGRHIFPPGALDPQRPVSLRSFKAQMRTASSMRN